MSVDQERERRPAPVPAGAVRAGSNERDAILTVHLDAETLWTSRGISRQDDRVAVSQGTYGARRGAALLLDLLARLDMTCTWFVPGEVAITHPDVVRRIRDDGHEIAHHGFSHERLAPASTRVEQRDILERGLEALDRIAAVRPTGYCAPGWRVTEDTLPLLVDLGFEYATNLMDDIRPYVHEVDSGPAGTDSRRIVELPVSWTLDDAPFRLLGDGVARPYLTAEQLVAQWRDWFLGLSDPQDFYNLTIHPQFSGRPDVLLHLEPFLGEVAASGTARWRTCQDVVADVLKGRGEPTQWER